ncbi:MAG: FAD-dependent oxidoreductase [Bacteroidota bacterium]
MRQETEISLSPKEASDASAFRNILCKKAGISSENLKAFRVIRRSVDARSSQVKVVLRFELFIDEEPTPTEDVAPLFEKNVENATPVVIAGAGPAGLFAALRLIELGIKPIILERGKAISERKRDIAQITRFHKINPDSNWCFGEGGAGTFSDGKLFTRSTGRGDTSRVLRILIHHGAKPEILYDAHPHIGTDRLPDIIKNIRKTIISAGGEIHFNSKVTGLMIKNKKVTGLSTDSAKYEADAVILATGHSSRDIYQLLHYNNIPLQVKHFAVGVRIEHPQKQIDSIQYHCKGKRSEFLPPASYSLAAQVDNIGVYSFCMCPGGMIVPAATGPGELVVNGMSNSQRNSPFANAGIVTAVDANDFKDFEKSGVLSGLRYQAEMEKHAFIAGGSTQAAPAQKLMDFLKGKLSSKIPETSYTPGLASAPLHEILPFPVAKRLKEGLKLFEKKMRGFLTDEAVLIGVESRTSSPLRIPRYPDTYEHIQFKGLFPCGEGSGYSGGIMSSALDGERCADHVAEKILKHFK